MILGQEDPLEEMATHCSILTWEIPWTEEPGGPQFMGFQELDVNEWLNNNYKLKKVHQKLVLIGEP